MLFAAAWPQSAPGQGVEAQVGRFYEDDGWSSYRFGVSRPIGSVVRLQLHADVLRRVGGAAGGFAGLGADVTAFRNGSDGPYLVAGLAGGLGSANESNFSEPWGSWSAGLGYELFPVSFLSVGAEARWRGLTPGNRGGLEIGAGLSLHLGGERPIERPDAAASPSPTALSDTLTALAPPGAPAPNSFTAVLADSIIATATEAMGRRYQYGGTGENGEGFDCSGLIQYAFGQHGIRLPRRSEDQAREGRAISPRVDELLPGDLLTFSNRGRRVTHVGLYLGEGRFIHSASRGVQISTLSAEDPYGRWWFKRWVGARRIVGE